MDKGRCYNYEAMEQGKVHSLIALHLLQFQTRGDHRVFMGWWVLASLSPYTILWWWEGNGEAEFWWKTSLSHPLQMKAPLITMSIYPWDECFESVKLWSCGGSAQQKIEQFSAQNQLVTQKERPCLILDIHSLGSKKDLPNELGKAIPVVALPGFSRLIFLDVYQLPGLPLQAQRTLGGGLHWVETMALEGASGVRARDTNGRVLCAPDSPCWVLLQPETTL